MLDAIVRAGDVNGVEDAIINELNRRKITPGSVKATVDTPIKDNVLKDVDANCRKAGYSGAALKTGLVSAAQVKTYINYIKDLYNRIVVP